MVRAVLCVSLCLPLLIPLLHPGMIQSHEGLSYPIRLVELAQCWEDGFLSARWFPDLFYGQGYPFLCFYAPGVFYLAGVLHAAGVGVALSLKLTVVLATLAGAGGAYRLAREAWSAPAALVGAALYVYAPYHVRDLFIRGDLAEFLALGFLPWGLWAMVRLRRRWGVRDVALAAFAGGLPILSHNITGLFTGGAMILAGAGAVVFSERRGRTAAAVLAAGVGTLLVTAFFWAGALHERQWVHIDTLTEGHFAVERHFVHPLELLLPGRTPGAGQELPMSFEIGYPLLALALAGLITTLKAKEWRRPIFLMATALAALGLILTTSLGAPFYRMLPMLRFVQFPWRFLGVASLGGALLGAGGAEWVIGKLRERIRWPVAIALVAVTVILVSPILGPKRNFAIPPWALDPAAYQKHAETTTRGEYLPLWVTRTERPRDFEDGVRIRGGGRIETAERRAGSWQLTLTADESVTVTLRELYYPSWRGWLGPGEVSLRPSAETGHIEFSAPAGRHEFRAQFAATPLRRVTGWISGIVSVLLAVALVIPRRRTPADPRGSAPTVA